MSKWDQLAKLRESIPKGTQVYRVDIRYDNIVMEHRVYIELTDWSNDKLGMIDAPLGYSQHGFYSTEEKALEAVKAKTYDYKYPVKIM